MGKDTGERFMQTVGTKKIWQPAISINFHVKIGMAFEQRWRRVKDPVSIHGRLTDNLRFADNIDLNWYRERVLVYNEKWTIYMKLDEEQD